jgi:hypothetical protein
MPFSLAILALVLLQTWILRPIAAESWVPPVGAAVISLGMWHAWRSGDWGWSSRALLPGLALTGLFTVACAVGLVLAGRSMGEPAAVELDPGRLRWLLVWGGAQQWLLQTTLLREAERLGGRGSWVAAPLLFGALHLPNPFLTIVTTVAALGWCAIYRRHPNVVPLAISHAVGTQVILSVFDGATTGQLRVGAGYLELP